MGSTVVHIARGDPFPASLALMAGLALHQAVSQFRSSTVDPSQLILKWPNDLLCNDTKLAGILLEMQGQTVIVGIGVNLVQAPDIAERKVATLSQCGYSVDRDAFAEALAHSFARELGYWRNGGLAPMLRRWQSVAHPMGTPLTVLPPGEDALNGTFAGLSDDGNLCLHLADGSRRIIHAGDVLLA